MPATAIRANREEPPWADLYDDLIIMLHSHIAATVPPVPVLTAVPGAPSPTAVAGRLVAERLSDRLAALLRRQIDSGALRPGDRLPTEADRKSVV